eukprot:4775949-Pyramimonas_sp.AAC.2
MVRTPSYRRSAHSHPSDRSPRALPSFCRLSVLALFALSLAPLGYCACAATVGCFSGIAGAPRGQTPPGQSGQLGTHLGT